MEVAMPYTALSRGRWSQPYRIYSVTAVTNGRRPVFKNFRCARLLIAQIRTLHDVGAVNSLVWVLMPDHLHWLFELRDQTDLAQVMKLLKARSAREINRHLGGKGPLWQRAFYDRAVRRSDDLRVLGRYIVDNPLRAGLVTEIGQYSHWDCVWIGDEGGVCGL